MLFDEIKLKIANLRTETVESFLSVNSPSPSGFALKCCALQSKIHTYDEILNIIEAIEKEEEVDPDY